MTGIHQATHRDQPVVCVSCGRKVARRMRGQRYCSAQCRDRGRGRSRKALFNLDTGVPATPLKKHSKVKGLASTKSGPRAGICAPARVIQTECYAGCVWQRVTSRDGVVVQVTKLSREGRSRAGARVAGQN